MRFISLGAGLALALAATAAFAQPAPSAPAAMADHYTTAVTPIGALLDDPAAKAVLAKFIPEVVSNPQIDMARGMTLKDTQQYAPDMVSDATLVQIDAELAHLPVRK